MTEGNAQSASHADEGKLRWDLLPFTELEDVVQVLEFGAKKYSAHNWRKGMPVHKVFNSTLRHLFAWWRGEDIDPESGLPHLAHAICNILFIKNYLSNPRLDPSLDTRLSTINTREADPRVNDS